MPKEFDALVKKIKRKGGAQNPFAVARAVLGSDKQIMARRKRKRKQTGGRNYGRGR